jgi:predicted transcriptional regulator
MKNPLSQNEFKIMQLLWQKDRPLSRPEIIAMVPERDWNPNSIHLILNNMIEKGVIRVEGMTRCGRGYGRTYAATMSNLEYAVNVLQDVTPDLSADERAVGVMTLLLDDLAPETVARLREILEAK